MKWKGKEIKIGKRLRRNPGNMKAIKALAASIEKLGLIEPIVLAEAETDTYTLVSGRRRMKALELLKYEDIPDEWARVVHLDNPLHAEFDENILREDYTISEIVAIADKFEEEHKEEKATKPDAGSGEGAKRDYKKDTRYIKAKRVGLSHATFEKAKAIIRAAKKEPETYGDLMKRMDKEGRVDGVYKELRSRKNSNKVKTKRPVKDELSKPTKNAALKVPDFVDQAMTSLPIEKQEELVNEFGEYICHVRRPDFDRAVRHFSKGAGLTSMDEDTIGEALKDLFKYTKKTETEWIFMQPIRAISFDISKVVKAKGANIDLMDKVEFAVVLFSMSMSLLYGFLRQANKTKRFKDIPEDTVRKILDKLTKMDELYEARLFPRIGAARREEIGDVDDHEEERKAANAMQANANIENKIKEMKYYRRKLLSNPTSTIVKVGDEMAERSIPTLSSAPGRKPSPKMPSNGSSRSALPDRNI